MCEREYDGAPGAEDCKELRNGVVVGEIAGYLDFERVVWMQWLYAGCGIGGFRDQVDDGTSGCHGGQWLKS